MHDLLNKQEELHNDLIPFIGESPLGLGIFHPLVHEIFYTPHLNAVINAGYLMKKERLKEAEASCEWSTYIFLHNRPYRMDALKSIKSKLSKKVFWEMFANAWIDSENLWQNQSFIKSSFEGIDNIAEVQKFMMNKEEMNFLNLLPEKFVLWRGHQKNRKGFSWTFSYWRARWFAQRFNSQNPQITCGTFYKKDLIAILFGRNEMEAIVDSKKASTKKTFKIDEFVFNTRRPKWLSILIPELISFSKKLSCHNHWHWEKVERNAVALSNQDSRIDKIVCQAFAWLHDTQRINDDDDPDHGERASNYAKSLYEQGKLKISLNQLQILQEACVYHDKGKVSDNPTIGACWDADRLDLTRVNIIPDRSLLSTEVAKNLLWTI